MHLGGGATDPAPPCPVDLSPATESHSKSCERFLPLPLPPPRLSVSLLRKSGPLLSGGTQSLVGPLPVFQDGLGRDAFSSAGRGSMITIQVERSAAETSYSWTV